jgi:hypothetical protein
MKHGRNPLGILCILMVLLLNVMVACPELHQLIHHDADEPGHQCAVTMFAHGQVDLSVVVMAMPAPAGLIEFLPRTSVSVFHTLVKTLPPGRGPPVSLLLA